MCYLFVHDFQYFWYIILSRISGLFLRVNLYVCSVLSFCFNPNGSSNWPNDSKPSVFFAWDPSCFVCCSPRWVFLGFSSFSICSSSSLASSSSPSSSSSSLSSSIFSPRISVPFTIKRSEGLLNGIASVLNSANNWSLYSADSSSVKFFIVTFFPQTTFFA